MKMCYARELAMPSSYAVMDEREMTYTEGGIEIAVSRGLLNKNECSKLGMVYGPQVGLSSDRVAKEIYAHAVLYYASSASMAFMARTLGTGMGIGTDIAVLASLQYIKNHANPINLGGDSVFRITIFNAIWNVY